MKKSFKLFLDSLDVLDELTDEQSGQLFKAIRAYELNQEEILTGLMKAIFTPFKNNIDRAKAEYEAVCERNRANGMKGGRPNQSKPTGLKSNPNNPDKDKDKDKDKEKEKDKVNKQCIINKGTEEIYLNCNEANKLFVEYLSLRKKMKLSNSKTVITRLINKLEDFSKKGHSSIDVISNAIIGSWKDFYEPKQTNQPRSFKQQENDAIDQSVENYYRMKENGFDLQEELIKQSQRDNQQGRHNELN